MSVPSPHPCKTCVLLRGIGALAVGVLISAIFFFNLVDSVPYEERVDGTIAAAVMFPDTTQKLERMTARLQDDAARTNGESLDQISPAAGDAYNP